MKINNYLDYDLDLEEINHIYYAYFIISFVLNGKYVEQEQAFTVDISKSEFNKLTKAKQNKLKSEWELSALKGFIHDLFNDDEIISKPTDFVSCNFKDIKIY